VPSAGLRKAGEGAFLVLLALGLVLARFDPIVIVVVLAVAAMLVALLEHAGSRRAARSRTPEEHPDELPAAPPHLESSKLKKAPRRRPRLPKAAPPPRQPEPEPASAEPPREWNVWELERAVRDAGDGERQEEWGALLIYLREFANAGGDLPPEFDGLVRESFGEVLAEPTTATAS
jgi:hypothetical protein